MLVSNHLLAGAAIGVAARRNPVAAFAVGLASHLLLDACPHWGMALETDADERRFLQVARCDGCCGLAIMGVATAAAGSAARAAVLAGMAGALVLDLDKPCKHFFGFDPFPKPVQRFHARIQNESPRRMPQEVVVGLLGAVAVAGLFKRVLAR